MPNNAIDLWMEDLIADDEQYATYWDSLDDDERAKALRFVHVKHRHQYVISHGKLRLILAKYLSIKPKAINYAFGKHGKPYLSVDGKAHAVKFNLSHSGDKMVVAIGSNNFMGVDIEAWNNQIDHLAVANQCFADTEKTTWLTLSEDEKSAMFYQLWTRKESFAKATGSGIALDVSKVITTFENGISRFVCIPSYFGNVLEWKLVDLDFDNGLSGTLTVKTNEFFQLNFQSLSIW